MLRHLDPAHRRIAQGFVFLGVICVLSVGGYAALGWPVSDAVYMVIITIFSVGYGEVHPVTGGGRWFTSAVVTPHPTTCCAPPASRARGRWRPCCPTTR